MTGLDAIKVLVVDDEPFTRKTIRAVLRTAFDVSRRPRHLMTC
jgi:chemotaxis response regulator CheB